MHAIEDGTPYFAKLRVLNFYQIHHRCQTSWETLYFQTK